MYKLYVVMQIPNELVQYLKSNNLEVHVAKKLPLTRKELLDEVLSVDCDAIFCTPSITLDKELLDLAPNLKVIGTLSVGYNHIDLKECLLRNIKVGHTPGLV